MCAIPCGGWFRVSSWIVPQFSVVSRRAAAPGLLRLGCCAWFSSLKVTCWGVSKTYATNSFFGESFGFGTSGSYSTGGFSLFLVFECGFCFVDVARCVFCSFFECDSITVSLSFPYSHMLMSSFWTVLAWDSVVPEVLLPADDITAYEYLLTLRVF